MTRQITHVSIHQTSKVFGLLYFALSLLFVPIAIGVIAASPKARGMGMFLIFAPILYGIVGYLGSALFAAIYNFLARRVGGVEFESVDKSAAGIGA
jgi:putative effector of murein hydrolase LrgA (UPF0299 family)